MLGCLPVLTRLRWWHQSRRYPGARREYQAVRWPVSGRTLGSVERLPANKRAHPAAHYVRASITCGNKFVPTQARGIIILAIHRALGKLRLAALDAPVRY